MKLIFGSDRPFSSVKKYTIIDRSSPIPFWRIANRAYERGITVGSAVRIVRGSNG